MIGNFRRSGPSGAFALGVGLLLGGLGASAGGCSTNSSGPLEEFQSPVTATDAGIIEAGEAGVKVALAERLFREIEPELQKKCGSLCHEAGATESSPPWLKAPAYDTIRSHPGIVVRDVYSSKLLIKPNHLGISLQDKALAPLREKVIAWITAEGEAQDESKLPATDAFPVVNGANVIDLSRAGKDIGGARLLFEATIHQVEQNQILQLQNVRIEAPKTKALKVTHPVFIIVPEGKDSLTEKDPTDQFSTVDQTIAAGASAQLGPGAAMLVRFPVKAQLKIQFEKLSPPVEVGAGRQCKSVAAFTANAVPAIQANACLTCHGGPDQAAVTALDMRKVGTDDAAACVQLLRKVNFADRSKSAIVLAPTSGNTLDHQGGKTIDPASDFVTKMMAWVQTE